ncbi:hypothetical protein FOZ60_008328, partial [Perkinsus olseni]
MYYLIIQVALLLLQPARAWVLVGRDGTITFLGRIEIDASVSGSGITFRHKGVGLWDIVAADDINSFEVLLKDTSKGSWGFTSTNNPTPVMALLRTSRGMVLAGSLSVKGQAHFDEKATVYQGLDIKAGEFEIQDALHVKRPDSGLDTTTTYMDIKSAEVYLSTLSIGKFVYIHGDFVPPEDVGPSLSVNGATQLLGKATFEKTVDIKKRMSVEDYIVAASSLSVRSFANFGSLVGIADRLNVFGYPSEPDRNGGVSVNDVTRLGGPLSVASFPVTIMGTVSVFNKVDVGSTLSVYNMMGLGSTVSLRSYARMGSSISVYGASRFGSSLSVFDFAQMASSISLRAYLRVGSTMSTCGLIRCGSAGSVLDFVNMGSAMSAREPLSILDFVNMGSSMSIRSYSRL